MRKKKELSGNHRNCRNTSGFRGGGNSSVFSAMESVNKQAKSSSRYQIPAETWRLYVCMYVYTLVRADSLVSGMLSVFNLSVISSSDGVLPDIGRKRTAKIAPSRSLQLAEEHACNHAKPISASWNSWLFQMICVRSSGYHFDQRFTVAVIRRQRASSATDKGKSRRIPNHAEHAPQQTTLSLRISVYQSQMWLHQP